MRQELLNREAALKTLQQLVEGLTHKRAEEKEEATQQVPPPPLSPPTMQTDQGLPDYSPATRVGLVCDCQAKSPPTPGPKPSPNGQPRGTLAGSSAPSPQRRRNWLAAMDYAVSPSKDEPRLPLSRPPPLNPC